MVELPNEPGGVVASYVPVPGDGVPGAPREGAVDPRVRVESRGLLPGNALEGRQPAVVHAGPPAAAAAQAAVVRLRLPAVAMAAVVHVAAASAARAVLEPAVITVLDGMRPTTMADASRPRWSMSSPMRCTRVGARTASLHR